MISVLSATIIHYYTEALVLAGCRINKSRNQNPAGHYQSVHLNWKTFSSTNSTNFTSSNQHCEIMTSTSNENSLADKQRKQTTPHNCSLIGRDNPKSEEKIRIRYIK